MKDIVVYMIRNAMVESFVNEIGVFGLMMVHQRCHLAISIVVASPFEATSWCDHAPIRRVILAFRVASGGDLNRHIVHGSLRRPYANEGRAQHA